MSRAVTAIAFFALVVVLTLYVAGSFVHTTLGGPCMPPQPGDGCPLATEPQPMP